MGFAREQKISGFAVAALSLLSLSLECTTATAGSSPLDARGQATPPKTNLFDAPPQRAEPTMTPDQQLKLEKDLTAARDRRGLDAKARSRPSMAPAQSKKPR